MDLKRLGMRWRDKRSDAPPSPAAVRRKMLGQSLIDGLLQVSGPMTRPTGRKLEGLWLEALSHPSLSRAAERIADASLPRPLLNRLIDAWIQAYDVDMSVAEVPPGGFATLDAFFTRRLLPGCRPIDHDPDVLVSPADSVLKSFGVIDARGRVPEVKARTYALTELLHVPDSDPLAASLIGGTYGVYYLSPRDYHRVHAPCAGVVRVVNAVAGASYPVNARGVRRIEGLFVRNKRTVFVFDSDDGPVVLVMVGATNVGRITSAVTAGERVEKGQELGTFHLGSTVVLLTTRDAGLDYLRVHEGELVRYGQAVMHRR